jgi:two-component system KDP operon response regulator KdpE
MSGARILVVDDEPQILRSLRLILTGYGYDVVTAAGGTSALEEIAHRLPDVILLDLMLPDISGIEICRRVRERSDVPIIILSARGDESSKVEALDLGADDYLTKPFSAGELLARVRVALRHAVRAHGSPVLVAGDLEIDFDRRRVCAGGREVQLTPKEYDVLKCLAGNAGRVLTHTFILRTVWGPEYTRETQYLRNVIRDLRRKLERDPSAPAHIITEPGVGYRFRLVPEP